LKGIDRNIDVTVSEVGPRDGLQSIKRTMATDLKIRWIKALADAGVPEIEVGSFVSPKLFPQLSDTGELVAIARNIEGLKVLALTPNLKGAEMALAARVHVISMPVSASREHSLANVRMTPEEAVDQVKRVRHLVDTENAGVELEVGIATAFGCSIQGDVSEEFVMRIAAELAAAGVDSIGLSDSVGYANPVQVRRMFKRLREEIGEKAGAAHFHNTRGQGLANVVAALEAGVTTFDASQGGIGGCPAAPGATGNIVTEDLVFLLESMGLRTGIDLEKLIAARAIIREGLPGQEIYGHVPDAGLPTNFSYAESSSR
jgi:hydroxymethylglutaryl-CoA lyase